MSFNVGFSNIQDRKGRGEKVREDNNAEAYTANDKIPLSIISEIYTSQFKGSFIECDVAVLN
jgi:hypothetical protein